MYQAFLLGKTGLRSSNIPDIEHITIFKFMLTSLASRNNLGKDKEREPNWGNRSTMCPWQVMAAFIPSTNRLWTSPYYTREVAQVPCSVEGHGFSIAAVTTGTQMPIRTWKYTWPKSSGVSNTKLTRLNPDEFSQVSDQQIPDCHVRQVQ